MSCFRGFSGLFLFPTLSESMPVWADRVVSYALKLNKLTISPTSRTRILSPTWPPRMAPAANRDTEPHP